MKSPENHRCPRQAVSRWAGKLLLLTLIALPACSVRPAARSVPAIVIHPTAASRAELEFAVSSALGGMPVRLADDALTRDSSLIIARAQARDLRGLPLNGRELGRPQHFRLLQRGSRCVLLHVESGKSRVLTHTSCQVLPDGHAQS
ncbi:MAG: hypothetical protein KGO22_09560 [Gammaproteobacteria bacterium]|nr:hypothetical protein [Gammaproteobacteria bacterium]